MKNQPSILQFGLGALGKHTLPFVFARFPKAKVTVVTRHARKALRTLNNLKAICELASIHADLSYTEGDATNIKIVERILASINPDIVVNTSSLLSWRHSSALSLKTQDFSNLGLGAWLPCHLSPAWTIASVLKARMPNTPFINAAFPDAVNTIINNSLGILPLGCGNIELLIPTIKLLTAQEIKCSIKDLEVKIVAHHSQANALYSKNICRTGRPHVEINLKQGGQIPAKKIKDILGKIPTFPRPKSPIERSLVVAAGLFNKMVWVLERRSGHGHMPGAEGLPGGYPIKCVRGKFRIDLPKYINLTQALRINHRGQRADGIAEIFKSGVVRYTRSVIKVFREKLKIELKELTPEYSTPLAFEILSKIRNYTKSH